LSRSSSIPKIAVVLFQHNEVDILEHWINFYSALFSPASIIILDNFSTDDRIEPILKTAEVRGCKVFRQQGPYTAKGDLIYKSVISHCPDCDIIIPADADEFLVSFDSIRTPYFSKKSLSTRLTEFWLSDFKVLAMTNYYSSIITHVNSSFLSTRCFSRDKSPPHLAKQFGKLHSIVGFDHGSHQAKMRYGSPTFTNELGFLHYHSRNPQIDVQRALNDCIGFGYVPAFTTLSNVSSFKSNILLLSRRNISGIHKIKELVSYLEHGIVQVKSNRKCTYSHYYLPNVFTEIVMQIGLSE